MTNNHTQPRIEKITVNIGVGEAGERLQKAEKVLESLTPVSYTHLRAHET